jgi:predicted PhzF superfamily epimerase YddE/YHI9
LSSEAATKRGARAHVVRVFCLDDGSGGNPLGVVLDGAGYGEHERQRIAAELNFSETVFVTDAMRGEIVIHTPTVELPLAGHPLVGAAWLLAHEGTPVAELRPPAGECPVRYAGEMTYVAGRPEWSPPFEFLQLDTPAEVDALDGPPEGQDEIGIWSWLDHEAGVIRARVFVPEIGIPEDEATGSAAMMLAAQLGREIDIRQGRASRILAAPLGDGMVEIGGLVVLDEVRDVP